jgi:hypothetical protein
MLAFLWNSWRILVCRTWPNCPADRLDQIDSRGSAVCGVNKGDSIATDKDQLCALCGVDSFLLLPVKY